MEIKHYKNTIRIRIFLYLEYDQDLSQKVITSFFGLTLPT